MWILFATFKMVPLSLEFRQQYPSTQNTDSRDLSFTNNFEGQNTSEMRRCCRFAGLEEPEHADIVTSQRRRVSDKSTTSVDALGGWYS